MLVMPRKRSKFHLRVRKITSGDITLPAPEGLMAPSIRYLPSFFRSRTYVEQRLALDLPIDKSTVTGSGWANCFIKLVISTSALGTSSLHFPA